MKADEYAFPYVSSKGEMFSFGMTLRDYFAAKAMQMLRADLNPRFSAARAYEMADEMLKVREQ